MLKPAAVRGVLCFAPSDGQKVRFTRPDRWLGEQPAHRPRRRRGRGRPPLPAHPRTGDARGLRPLVGHPAGAGGPDPRAAGRRGRRGRASRATPMPMLADDAATVARGVEPVATVRLLPGFDQYVIAANRHAERADAGPGDFRPLVYRNQGWISAVRRRRRPDRGRLALRAQGHAAGDRGRAVRAATRSRSCDARSRRRPSGSPRGSVARSSWFGCRPPQVGSCHDNERFSIRDLQDRRRPGGDPPGLRRHAHHRRRHLGPARGPRQGDRRPQAPARAGRRLHRHGRLVRPVRLRGADRRGAPPLRRRSSSPPRPA